MRYTGPKLRSKVTAPLTTNVYPCDTQNLAFSELHSLGLPDGYNASTNLRCGTLLIISLLDDTPSLLR